jgi:hypothetical protein
MVIPGEAGEGRPVVVFVEKGLRGEDPGACVSSPALVVTVDQHDVQSSCDQFVAKRRPDEPTPDHDNVAGAQIRFHSPNVALRQPDAPAEVLLRA